MLKKTFEDFITTQNLKDEKVLLMVSGGVDSMVLLDVAAKIIDKPNIAVFHLDHQARKDSHEDLNFVQKICSKMGVKFYSAELPPCQRGVVGDLKSKESNWRKARQAYSQKAAKDVGAKAILTAHHATDLVETMIFRLTKGCGVDGLSPFDTTTKPFWQIPKTEILKYAKQNKMEWQEDASNDNLEFERNIIRHKVLPELRKITPNLEKVFVRESQIFAEAQTFIKKSIKMYKTQISLEQFHELPKTLQTEWLRKVSKNTPSSGEIKDTLKWLNHDPKGNSHKAIGGTELYIHQGKIEC